MTKIDDNLILKLEKLSRLRLTEVERKTIQSDLESIVSMFDRLKEVDTEGVEPLRHITESTHPLREDVVDNELSHEEALKNAPQKVDGFIAVPKFLKPK